MPGHNSPTSKPSPSRETSSLPTKLVEGNTGLVGPKCNPGLSDRFLLNATSTCNTSLSSILCRADSPDIRGGNRVTTEGGNRGDSTGKATRILFEPLSCSQERWRETPSNKSQISKQLCKQGTFQDGGHPYIERHPATGGLVSQNRSKGRLFLNTHSPKPQKVPQVHFQREGLPIQLPTLRPILSSLGVYKNPKTSTCHSQGKRCTAISLHRRHTNSGRVQGPDPRPGDWNAIPPAMSGIYCKHQEISTESSSGDRISGPVCGLSSNGDQASSNQNQTDSSRGSQTSKAKISLSPHACTTTGQDECYKLCPSSRAPVLSLPTNGSNQHIGAELSMLRSTSSSDTRVSGGAGMVGQQHVQVEWQDTCTKGYRSSDRIRCIPGGMGCPLLQTENRGTLVPAGTVDAHQLPRTACSDSGNQNLCKVQDLNIHPTENRQHHSSSLHKQPGRNSLQGIGDAHKEPVDVVPGKEYPHYSSTLARCTEHNSRHRVSGNVGQDRLEIEPCDIPENHHPLWTPRHGPVCIQTVHPVPTLLQLAARSLCTGNRCIPPGLDCHEVLCESPMESGGPGTCTSTIPTDSSSASSSCLEGTTMVSNTSEHVDRPSSVNHSNTEEANQRRSHATSSSVSRMAHLRNKFRSQNLSEEATALLLKSWRTKTNKSYDSLFGKWHSWCVERSFNPFSGPVTNVANFLAQLCAEGYQYSSINSYRSAISSVHEKVDGYNVGQHPLISRLLKGIFHDRPPLPRYTSTWNVQTVLNYLEGLGENQSLPLKDLSWKLAMLLALTRPSRSADLSQLDLKRRVHKPDGVCFYPNVLAKQSRQGSQIAHFFFPSLPENPTLCPVMTLKAYEDRTKPIRDNEPRLFISFIKPYKAVTSSSVARWLKAVLTAAGIDTAIFSAHSTRGASSSAAAKVGITTNDILKAADWSSESVFQKFYYKPSDNPSYGRAVLSNSATNNTVDMRD